MEGSIASSYKAGLYRLLGTLVGASVGIIFVLVQPGNAILSGLGTLVFIFICNIFNWNRAVPIAGVAFASVMFSLGNKSPLQYSYSRVLDTLVGIVIAVVVNYLIFPPNNLMQMRKGLNAISERISTSIAQFVCSGSGMDLDTLKREVIDSIKALEAYRTEFKPKTDRDNEFFNISKELESLRSILAHLKTVDELSRQCSPSPDNIERLRHLSLCDIKVREYTDNNLNLIFNYHLSEILDTLPNLSPKMQ